jgi:uncharacterized protein YbaR (Trm112 family)/SAM-dependent methyltransferase
MRYALLDFLACPYCLEPLACVTHREMTSKMPTDRPSDGTRTSPGPGVGPVPRWPVATDLASCLASVALPPAPPERGRTVEVRSGLLICARCGRWYPIEEGIPELLPDYLRDDRDLRTFDAVVAEAPASLAGALRRSVGSRDTAADPGAHYKKAEINIKDKVTEQPLFFVPGSSSPFAYWDADFSMYLINLFGSVAPLLEIARGDVLLDSGCGYAWTTEWLFRSGYDPIGIDICRTYLDVGIKRIGLPRPHLVVADVEHLPLTGGCARAVLAFESFHHIPDRKRAIGEYERVLGEAGTVILAEPGASHEHATVSEEAMKKYGILEKGMELNDVKDYAKGTVFSIEQLFVVRATLDQLGAPLDRAFVQKHSAVPGNVFRLAKGKRHGFWERFRRA